ncbi:MAG: 50S ribosome-binding GTPase [Eubacterium sp.]|nr:50S ribosome-binding GTPase [Eubacterium sp.]
MSAEGKAENTDNQEEFVSKLMKEFEGSKVRSGEFREGMDRLCEAMEDEILNSNFSDDIKKQMMKRLRRFKTTKTNIMLVGATGCGKSSTINALFSVESAADKSDSTDDDYHYVEVAKVGTKADPETKVIEKYTIGNLTLWDTPGLGDSTDEDESHTKVIEDLLDEEDDEGNALIDLVLVVLEGASKDLGTTYKIMNDIIFPRFEDDPGRVLVALNQSDIAMKTGRHWDYEKNIPDETLVAFLEEKVKSIHDRILEDSGIEVDPVYYCAGYMEAETGEVVRPYNLSKLLLCIVNAIPPVKRIAVFEGLNTDSENYEYNDNDYGSDVSESFFDTVGDIMEGGMELGHAVLGLPGAIVGGVLGAAVGVVAGLFQKIFC